MNIYRNRNIVPFSVLWTLEVWERFGYYGLQAILAMYFVKSQGYSNSDAMLIFGSFTSLLYGMVLVGGYVGDNYIGAKRTIIIGSVILFSSYLLLSYSSILPLYINISENQLVLYALSGVAVGGGLFKPNPLSLISKLYDNDKSSQDVAMTIYYMAINLGSLFSIFITPIIANQYGYQLAFLCSAIGLLIGIVCYLSFYSKILHIQTKAGSNDISNFRVITVILLSLLSIFMAGNILEYTRLCSLITITISLVAFIYLFKEYIKRKADERKRIVVALILSIQAIFFYVMYQQMPTSLTFFVDNNVDKYFLGIRVYSEQWQLLNPLMILCLSPLVSIIYKKYEISYTTKFCMGMFLCSLAFLIMYIPQFVTNTGVISGWWIFFTYLLQSSGELLISALGLSMITTLFPRDMSGFAIGIWCIATMIAAPIGGLVGSMTSPSNQQHIIYTKMQSLHVYGNVFVNIGLCALLIAIIMLIFKNKLNEVISK